MNGVRVCGFQAKRALLLFWILVLDESRDDDFVTGKLKFVDGEL